MWEVYGDNLKMTVGDYGVELPLTISGTTLTASDEIKFTAKHKQTGSTILEKTFSNISANTVNLVLTKKDSNQFRVGEYRYSLDWYQDNVFMCNIIPDAQLMVVNKV